MRKLLFVFALGLLAFTQCQSKQKDDRKVAQTTAVEVEPEKLVFVSDQKIQVALLLDTSNSMDGLIEQAKSRLWNIVNTLTTLKYQGKEAQIEIALYEYGNDGLSSEKNWIRQVAPLTQDLDLISEKLFALNTNGGSEYCGAVISEANQKLDWDGNTTSMKLIYIAGNEPFDQGGVNFNESIADSRKRNIFVNTIYCGGRQEGIEGYWQKGAEIGEGKYFHIDSDRKVVYIATPYDQRIDECNTKLNNTYIGYGRLGSAKIQAQAVQDSNAEAIAMENKVARTVSKSKKNAYKNASWDLVDKVEEEPEFLEMVKEEALPEPLRGKSKQELQEFVEKKSKEREAIQKEIGELARKRQAYIEEELKKRGESDADDLGKAIEKSILELAERMGYTAE